VLAVGGAGRRLSRVRGAGCWGCRAPATSIVGAGCWLLGVQAPAIVGAGCWLLGVPLRCWRPRARAGWFVENYVVGELKQRLRSSMWQN
jgi:hypothetical protein